MANNPTLLKMPLAADGEKTTIPETTGSTTGEFSQQYGFQAINALPLQAGGIAPKREDMNGVFNLLGGVAYYAQKGWTFKYDSTQAYFAGCVVIDPADGKRYECISDVAAGGTAPNEDTSGTYWKRYSLGDGLPLGAIIPYTSNGNLPAGYLVCDGAAVSRTMYPDLFDLIGTTYGDGDGSTTFNLPDLTNKFIEGHTTAGTEKSAGLPNIAAGFRSYGRSESGYNPLLTEVTGAMQMVQTQGDTIAFSITSAYGSSQGYNFDASRSSAIYGSADTVQPEALTLRYIIKAFDGQTEDGALIDVTQYAEDLAQKATRGLDNLTAAGKKAFSPSSTFVNVPISSSGQTFTTTGNGVYFIEVAATANSGFVIIKNTTTGLVGGGILTSTGFVGYYHIPAEKGDVVEITYSNVSINNSKFFLLNVEV